MRLAFILSLSIFMLANWNSTFGQITITGKVVLVGEEATEGVTVQMLDDETNSAETNSEGYFELEVPALPVTLQARFLGFYDGFLDIYDNTENVEIILEPIPGKDAILGEAVVTSSKIKSNESYELINGEDLNFHHPVSIAQALNTVPGVLMHSGTFNTNRITIRGIGNRSLFSTAKLRAYYDNIPLTSGVGETTIEDLDPATLSSATIYKGPQPGHYGAGLGGTIVLDSDNLKRNNEVSTDFSMGHYGLMKSTNALTLGDSDKSINLNYSYTGSDGYRDNNEYTRHAFNTAGRFDYSQKGKLTYLVNYMDLKAEIPSSLDSTNFADNPRDAAFVWGRVEGFEDYEKMHAGISHKYDFNGNLSHTASVFGTYYDSYESRPFNILTETSRALGFSTSLFMDFITYRDVSEITIGGEFFNEKYDWQTYETNSGSLGEIQSDNIELRNYANLYVNADWKLIRNLKIQTGLNVNTTAYQLTDFYTPDSIDYSGDYRFNTIFSPRVGVHYLFNNLGISVYGLAAHGFSPPSLEETLTPEGGINPNIQPETGWNYELGSKGALPVPGGWEYQFSMYYMDIRNLLVAERVGADQYVGRNAGRTGHFGIEYDMEGLFYNKNNMQLRGRIGYAYSRFKFVDFIDEDEDYSGNELTGTAPHKLNFDIDFRMDVGLYARYSFMYLDAMPMRDDNSIYSDAYNLSDIRLGYEKQIKDWNIHGYLGLNNVFNKKYASMILINASSFGGNAPRYFYPGMPFNVFGGVKLTYSF